MLKVTFAFDHAPMLESRFQVLSRIPDNLTEVQLMQSTSSITTNTVCLYY